MITTNDDGFAASCRSIQSCGRVEGGLWYEHHVIAGNYRLGEFQGAVLDCQLDRLAEQTARRDANGQWLAKRLAQLPGVHPQQRPGDLTRHSYHLFMLRLDAQKFGAPRAAVLKALQAEGIPCTGGYGYPLTQQPLFRNKAFGPYLPEERGQLDFANARVPNAELICREQGVWLEQSMLLGPEQDMEDIARAFEKIHKHAEALRS
jgi:dTDP-4-amino-4,6-dideoxygalactose transaminase